MRQGQHKGRQRNRGPRRQGGNPSNRVFESNGPDVKVRGTAQTVADKYLQLARDSVSSGDTVTAESYFQHAEHYLRIIAANQPQHQPNQQQHNRQQAVPDKQSGEVAQDGAKEDKQSTPDDAPGSGPQPDVAEAKATSNDSGTESTAGASEGSDSAGFDGQTPDFLAKPAKADEAAADDKPKRSRKPSTRSRSAKSNGAKAPEADAAGEAAGDDSPDAEAVAS